MARTLRARTGIIALTLSGGLALAACGSDGSTAGGAGATPNATAELSGTLTVLHYYDEGAGALTGMLPEWEKRFEKDHPKVDVKFEYTSFDQMQTKVISAAAAGKGWDVIMPTGVWLPEMIKAGAVQPLGTFFDASKEKAQFPDNTQSAGQYRDKRYAVQAYTNIEGIFYNKTILDKIGVKVPTNLDELEAAMEKAKAEGYNALATAAPPGTGGEFNVVPWLVSNGWTYEDPGNAGAKDILNRLQKWRDAKYFSPNDASGFVAEKNFATGKYAFAQGGNWNLGTFKKDLDFEWGAAVVKGIDKSLLGGELLSVGSKAKDPNLAWRFIEETFLSTQGAEDAAKAGAIPLRADMKDAPVVTGDPNLSAFAEIAGQSIGNPVNKNTGKISDVVGGSWNEFVAGKIPADEAAQRIAQGVPPLMTE